MSAFLAPLASVVATPIPLWPGEVPGALGAGVKDVPTLAAYHPEPRNANGTSLLILPGGGYAGLAAHEGEGYARWFSQQGVTCYVLTYRLGSAGYRHPVMWQDATRALRTVRAWARRDGLDPARVGVIGSSAGGHLASMLLTRFDAGAPGAADVIERESSRPDFGILCYPVITMGEFTHAGSRQNLLGEHPSAEQVSATSSELLVSPATPPCFLWHTADDHVVPVENVLLFASALRRARVPFELHVYESGAHGLGLPATNPAAPPWDVECLRWLRARKFLPAAAAGRPD